MNEVKRARQLLDERNGLAKPPREKKPRHNKPKKGAAKNNVPPRTGNTAKENKKSKPGKASANIRKRTQTAAPARGPESARVATRQQSSVGGRSSSRTQPQMRRQAKPAAQPMNERERLQRSVTAGHRRRRKKRYTLYYIILFLFVVIAGIVLSLTVFFNIDTITVEGSGRYGSDEIIAASGLHTGDNLFRINTGRAERQIVDALVFVDRVQISRSFPNSIVITVTDAQPVMSFSNGGSYSTVSEAGRILETGLAQPAENTFVVNGVEIPENTVGTFLSVGSGEGMDILNEINAAAESVGLDNITRVDINSVVDIRVFLDNRFRVDLGNISDLEYKLTFAKELAGTRLGENETGIIDVQKTGTAYFRPASNLEDESEPSGTQTEGGEQAASSEDQPSSSEEAPSSVEESTTESQTANSAA